MTPPVPLRGIREGNEFGARRAGRREGYRHRGIDMGAREGTHVVAPVAGTVILAGPAATAQDPRTRLRFRGYGPGIVYLAGEDGRYYLLAHVVPRTREGAQVAEGEHVADVAAPTDDHGAHLHFEVRTTRRAEAGWIDPYALLTGAVTAYPTATATTTRETPSRTVPRGGPWISLLAIAVAIALFSTRR